MFIRVMSIRSLCLASFKEATCMPMAAGWIHQSEDDDTLLIALLSASMATCATWTERESEGRPTHPSLGS